MRLLKQSATISESNTGRSGIGSLMVLLALFAMGCNKEKALQPSGTEIGYALPQGNQPFDQEIVAFHKQYGTYIIYKFKQSDFYLTVSDLIQDTATEPDPVYAGPAFYFLKKNMLDHYAPNFLQKNLPFKFLLTARIDSLYKIEMINDVRHPLYLRGSGFRNTNNMIAFGWANEELATMTQSQLQNTKGLLNAAFWRFMVDFRKMEIPVGYAALMQSTYSLNESNKYSRGYVTIGVGVSGDDLIKFDLLTYIAMITASSEAELETTLLSPSIDTNGWIRKKYDLVTSYYLSKYNIDLKAIGNTAVAH